MQHQSYRAHDLLKGITLLVLFSTCGEVGACDGALEVVKPDIAGAWAGLGLTVLMLYVFLGPLFNLQVERDEEKNLPTSPRPNGFFSKTYAKEPHHLGDILQIPENSCCPIGKELMTDPVALVGDGYTYERSNIEKWLESSDKSPMTGEKLSAEKLQLIPNVTKAVEHDHLVFQAKMRYLADRKTTRDEDGIEINFLSLPTPAKLSRSRSL